MINKLHVGKSLTEYLEAIGIRNEDVECNYGIPELKFTEDRLKYIEGNDVHMWTGMTSSMEETIKGNDVIKRFTISYSKRHDKFAVKILGCWYCTDIFMYPCMYLGLKLTKALKVRDTHEEQV